MAGIAPLQALTESAQKVQPKKQVKTRKEKRASTYAPVSKKQKKQTLTFDEDARREYLTGFSKRKNQRRQAAHDHVQKAIREEIRNSRLATAEARKRQAAENVRAEQIAYGLLDSDHDEEEENEDHDIHGEREFETDTQRAHVTIQELDVDDWPEQRPTSSNIHSKYPRSERNSHQSPEAKKPKPSSMQRNDRAPAIPSGSLTGILEPEVAQAAMADKIFRDTNVENQTAIDAKPKRPHSYMSKAERQQERQRQRAWNHAQAENRRAENRVKRTSQSKHKRT